MKKIINLLILLALSATWVVAQDEDDMLRNDPKAQEKIKAARIAFITERLGLTPAEAEKFWPVYNEFAMKRQDLRKEFEQARRNKPTDRSDEAYQKELVELSLKIKQGELDLEKEYSNRILNVINPQRLMALRKAEQDFRNMVLRQIQQRQLQQQRRQDFREKNEDRLRQRNN
jgi:hypothetical protein